MSGIPSVHVRCGLCLVWCLYLRTFSLGILMLSAVPVATLRFP